MNANELRIGNWLQDSEGNIYKVDFTTFSQIAILKSVGKKDEEFLFGIPITPEILEKAGWVWNEECNSFEKYPNGDARMNLHKKFNGGYTMFNFVIKALICENIWHLHQLQNLYFALTGEELEINL